MAKKIKRPTLDELRERKVLSSPATAYAGEAFECNGCQEIHPDKWDAENCCDPKEGFFCTVCGIENSEFFEEEADVEQHRIDEHADTDSTPEELYLDALRFSNAPVADLQRNILMNA